MDACKNARTYPRGQWHVCRRTQKGSETIQGIRWLLPWTLCPVVLLVFLRLGLLPVHLCHSHDGRQRASLVLIILCSQNGLWVSFWEQLTH